MLKALAPYRKQAVVTVKLLRAYMDGMSPEPTDQQLAHLALFSGHCATTINDYQRGKKIVAQMTSSTQEGTDADNSRSGATDNDRCERGAVRSSQHAADLTSTSARG